eukprot:TRINITY_DN6215_c0_g1_i4.p1 TRINITY_DN6215_c0_g1~~TRINITY_DN6215_c0_g1_i4.p1  ORF type:complete len:181 (-),score=11.33 TRINITY_DN6215_c0_g1_i4:269-811(-)
MAGYRVLSVLSLLLLAAALQSADAVIVPVKVTCTKPATLAGYTSSIKLKTGLFMHVKKNGTNLNVAVQAKGLGAVGWLSVAFSPDGQMTGDALVGAGAAVKAYTMSGHIPPLPNAAYKFGKASFTKAAGAATLKFNTPGGKVKIAMNGPNKITWAFGTTAAMSTHTPTNRGSVAVNLSGC